MKVGEATRLFDMTILVVDDEPDFCQLVDEVLSAKGYKHVIQSRGGEDAVKQLSGKRRIDLVLLDINMPRMNGYEVLAFIRRHPELDHVPVIMISGTGKLNATVRTIREGAEDFLYKPLEVELLYARVASCLEKKFLRDQERRLLRELEDEKERADSILFNVIPKPVAKRLKRGEDHIAELVPDVTVMFCDMVGFTPFASRLQPEKLVNILNELFLYLDHLAEEFDLEKIKTIGDNYMLCGGIGEEAGGTHPERCVEFGRAAIYALDRFNKSRNLGIRLRIGMNTGPVVAGIIGHKRPMFDMWGETVNLASRMESHGVAGRIQVSEASFKRLPPEMEFEARSRIKVKGKGWMQTYLSPEFG